MDFRLLGVVEVAAGAGRADLRGTKPKALLALLVLRANEVVPMSRLVDALWGDDPPRTAVETLHGYVSGLRRALGRHPGGSALLATVTPGYVLRARADQIDVRRFEALAAAGRRALLDEDWEAAASSCRSALDQWRGPALADVSHLAFAQVEIVRLEEARLRVIEDRVTADLALGQHRDLVGELEPLTTDFPLREQLWGHLMLALYRCGRQAEALRAYQRLRRTLGEQLGIGPSPVLERLERRVLEQDPTLDLAARDEVGAGRERAQDNPVATARHDTVSGADEGRARSKLPMTLTSFVGRADDTAATVEILRSNRLLTLVGAGGVGKTRLAVEVAARAVTEHPDGVFFVELAPVAEPDRVGEEVRRAVEIPEQPRRDVTAVLVERLGHRRLLIVLDNCEHVIEACASLVEQLVTRCAHVRVLATSREPLLVPGEVSWRVRSLSTPAPGAAVTIEEIHRYEAPQLFLERVAQAEPRWQLRDGDVLHLAAICGRLDGVPLAIELAAAQARVLPLEVIAARLADRFSLLSGGWRHAPPRHQTLRATIDWSHDLLSAPERTVFSQLSVFAGGWTLEGAEEVCVLGERGAPAVAHLLVRLVDKSLVTSDDHRRFHLLETVRQYAREKLRASGQEPVAAERHASFFLKLAEHVQPNLHGRDLRRWLDVLEAERENFHAAVAWLAGVDDPRLVRLAAALWRYCYLRGHYRDGRDWLERALATPADAVPMETLAKALHGAGALALYECDYDRALDLSTRSLAVCRELGDNLGVASCLSCLGAIARERGDYELAEAIHREGLLVSKAAGDAWATTQALQLAGFAAWLSGAFERCQVLSGESLERAQALGDAERTAWALVDLAAVALYADDHARASELLDESLRLFTTIDFKEGLAWSLNLAGVVQHRRGNLEAAAELLLRSLAIHRDVGDRWRMASVLEALAGVLADAGEPRPAACLLGAAERLRAEIGTPVPLVERPARTASLETLRRQLGSAELRRACEAGRKMTADQACGLAGANAGH